jgi:hypothetical protein
MKRKVICIVTIAVIVSVVFAIYKSDETRRIRSFINHNNVGTIHEPQNLHSSFSYKEYKDVVISNTEVMGIGYNDNEICLYSKDVDYAYIGYNGLTHWEYIEYCEIVFEWDNFGNSNFCAYVGYAPRSTPDIIKVIYRVDRFDNSAPTRFCNVELVKSDSYYATESLGNAARSSATILVREACIFLRNQGLPSLY